MRSKRAILISKIDKLLFRQLVAERGAVCQICGRTEGLGPFHILPKGSHPRLRFCVDNILITCWLPCHYSFHHDYYKAREIVKKIKEICGDDYEERLREHEKTQLPHKMVYLEMLYEGLK